MSIETYTDIMIYFYIGLFFLSVFAGMIVLWRKIRKKPLKYGWLVLYTACCSIFCVFHTFIPSIAYDDPGDPNYSRFENWKLYNFILNDIKMLVLCLLIGAALYAVFEKRKQKTSRKAGGIKILVFLSILLILLILFSITKFS